MTGIALAKATGVCPYCGLEKHQIDTTAERAADVVQNAIRKHIHEGHPEWAAMHAGGDR